ncbi:hypothetical protein MRX96_057074 [Rhipicephalus microplus]
MPTCAELAKRIDAIEANFSNETDCLAHDVFGDQNEKYKPSTRENGRLEFIEGYAKKIAEAKLEQSPNFEGVKKVLQIGPKFCGHPNLDKVELIGLVRSTVGREKDDETGRLVQEGVECLPQDVKMAQRRSSAVIASLRRAEVKLPQSDKEAWFVLMPKHLHGSKAEEAMRKNFKVLPAIKGTGDGVFLPEKLEDVIPFSAGKRSCPGEVFASMEVFLLVTFLLQSFLSEWLLRRRAPPGSRLPPMPPASSYRGHVEFFRPDFHRTICLKWAKEYGPVFRMKINVLNVVILNDYENIKKIIQQKGISLPVTYICWQS